MATRFDKARFCIATGPATLFERVRFKMAGARRLQMTAHAFGRAMERGISLDLIDSFSRFSSGDWDLVQAEVRTDSGKFVNSTWEKFCSDGMRYWITIGYKDAIETVIRKPPHRLKWEGKNGVVANGELYDFVARVNHELMEAEKHPRKVVKIDNKQEAASVLKFHGPKRLAIAMARPTWGQQPRRMQDAIIVAIYTGLELSAVVRVITKISSRDELCIVQKRVYAAFKRGRKYCKFLREAVERHPILECSMMEPHSRAKNSLYTESNLKPVNRAAAIAVSKSPEFFAVKRRQS